MAESAAKRRRRPCACALEPQSDVSAARNIDERRERVRRGTKLSLPLTNALSAGKITQGCLQLGYWRRVHLQRPPHQNTPLIMWLPLKTDYLPAKQAARRPTGTFFAKKVQQHIARRSPKQRAAFTSPSKRLQIKEKTFFTRKLDFQLDWAAQKHIKSFLKWWFSAGVT